MGRIQKKQTVAQKQKKQKKLIIKQQQQKNNGVNNSVSSKKSNKLPSVFKKQGKGLKGNTGVSFIANSDNVVNRCMQFLREVKVEFKKVTWPSRAQTAGSTVIVIILVIFVSFYLGLVDLILSNLIRLVLH